MRGDGTITKENNSEDAVKIWDAHTHLGKSKLWHGFPPSRRPEQLIGEMNKYGIEKAIIFANPSNNKDFFKRNDELAAYAARYPDRFIGFARVDPHFKSETEKYLKHAFTELGLKGIKLHPVVEKFDPCDENFYYIYEIAEIYNVPILFHFEENLSIEGIPTRFPKLKIILGHLKESSLIYLKNFSNVCVETSGCSESTLLKAITIDENRVLFGSDYPYHKIAPEIKNIERIISENRIKEKVYRYNLIKLLGL